MSKIVSIAILAISVASLLHITAAKTLVVGDDLGWLVPPGGDFTYAAWASINVFTVGDILVFNFTSGQQDVARVTKEAYLYCNSTNPVALKTTGPANFTLDTTGEYFFISTMDKHCLLGQRLAIYVIAPGAVIPSPGPQAAPSAVPNRAPVTYTVGDEMGWIVPPGAGLAYMTWAYNKTFIVGDFLVFNFVDGLGDVALVTKQAYETCDTNSTIQLWSTAPAKILLNATGDYFFTSTYPRRCTLGQQLAIRVVASSSGGTAPSSSIANPPSTTSNPINEVDAPSVPTSPPPASSAHPSPIIAGLYIIFLSISSIALF
ncbi:blue copper protein-like [Mercurialis annua]|uniref:blue copper protein-like n=1 Tax=Mercurialis annua TaxID=3986 RepID=UPI00215E1F15|nr:blue copper protein-like [Mercurialis annua]